ncbi:hypothetical protein BCR33DRAFT_768183 [Rhizoclosmatium globosum]|uniref:L domain-like protein n=1 Tax=Rhizoclosmatium globosum TaxID=329046 RepID=A0A1Y2BZI4_9FUNG|nr:hypothetical protein BCR33DRAFT_768183 [Rhizoclosmatium globosum]|eukprot:ORY40192.1 hypothetical protein BCR33DRAFT_768183 [Rhizoclosmatium globosum]
MSEQIQLDWSNKGLSALSLRVPPPWIQSDREEDWNRVVTWSLAENKLVAVPLDLPNRLTVLRYLNLKSNELLEFPPVLCEMKVLEILDLSRNKISYFPESLGTLQSTLKVFSIAKNRIKIVPSYFGSMFQLDVFKLDGNQIDWPPSEIISPVIQDANNLLYLKEYLLSHPSPETIAKPVALTDYKTETPCHQLVECHFVSPSALYTRPAVKSLLQASSSIYTTLSTLHRVYVVACAGKEDVFSADKALTELNLRVCRLVGVLDEVGVSPFTDPRMQQQNMLDTIESVRRAIEMGVLMQSTIGKLDIRVSRKVLGGLYHAQIELFDAIEKLGQERKHGVKRHVAGAPKNGEEESGDVTVGDTTSGEFRFRKRKEVIQLSDAIVEVGKEALNDLRDLATIPPGIAAESVLPPEYGDVPAIIEKALSAFIKSKNRLHGASSSDFALFQSFGEDTVVFIHALSDAASAIRKAGLEVVNITKAKQSLKRVVIAAKSLAMLLVQSSEQIQ